MSNLLVHRPASLRTPFTEGLDPIASMNRLMNWDPFQDMFGMTFPRSLGRLSESGLALMPPLEAKETPTSFVFKADLPGIKEEDVDVSISGNRLSLSGKRDAETREEGETYLTYERTFGSFNRTFTLPEQVDADKVNAELNEGVLTITLPKVPEARAKTIKVKEVK